MTRATSTGGGGGAPTTTADADADVDAETAAVDALTDGPLAGVDGATADSLAPLATVLADAAARPPRRSLAPSGARFDQLCLRKLHVAVARGGEVGAPAAAATAAAAALPPYITAVARALAGADAPRGDDGVMSTPSADTARADELAVAALDSVATLVAPPDAVAAAAAATSPRLAALWHSVASTADGRGHLLLLHSALARAAAGAASARTRRAARDALVAASEVLGLG